MSKENIYPFSIVDDFNEGLKLINKELQIVHHDGTEFYCVDILDIDEDGNTQNVTTFADNLSEDELLNAVVDANFRLFNESENENIDKDDFISFRIVHGGIHDTPALIYAITSIDLYFHDFGTDGIEKVTADSIDDYIYRNGEFCVHKDDYDVALQQIEEHDELGIEH